MPKYFRAYFEKLTTLAGRSSYCDCCDELIETPGYRVVGEESDNVLRNPIVHGVVCAECSKHGALLCAIITTANTIRKRQDAVRLAQSNLTAAEKRNTDLLRCLHYPTDPIDLKSDTD